MTIKSKNQLRLIRRAGRLVAACHKEIAGRLKPGVTTAEIDRFVESYMRSRGAKPAQKGYKGYPFAICASANDAVCHGFPDAVPLRSGDIVTIDMVAELDGWLADSAWTYPIGLPSPSRLRLLKAAEQALKAGIAAAVPGNRIGDIGHAVESVAARAGCSVVEAFVGHGIGRRMHEWPPIPHRGLPGTGKRLVPGMVITIEPILTLGRAEVALDADGWTARTVDRSSAAQYEHTIAVTDGAPVILTRL